MNFNQHYELNGKHAFLSASSYHWLNDSPEAIERRYINAKQRERGTFLHDLASRCILTRTKLANHKKALNLFVNDAIGFNMESEVILYYSPNAFGTADAISYNEETGELRIHDLKTGTSKPSFKQLSIYGAFFCLEYGINPYETIFIQRLYQGNGFTENVAEPEEIEIIINQIVEFDKVITQTAAEYRY